MDNTTPQPEVSDTTIQPEVSTPETKPDSKLSRLSKRFKSFAKTRRGKVVLFTVFILVVGGIAGGVYLYLNPKSEPELLISETIASDRIYDNYDFIYNSEDNKLIAATADRLKQLEIVSGEEKIMDYIISPDKRKITYSLSDMDYKTKITSTNADMTKLDFDPVAFTIYELDLETGTNTLIWSEESYELGATIQQLYKQKIVVYPDSYVVVEDWWTGVPYSYPVSNVQVENDIEAGYEYTYMPYDLGETLRKKSIKLYSYNSDGSRIVFASQGKAMVFNRADGTSQELVFPGDITNNCYSTGADWVSSIMVFDLTCNYEYSERRFVLDGLNLTEIDNTLSLGGPLTAVLTRPDYTLATMYSRQWPADFTPSLNILDFTTRSISNVKDLAEYENILSVETVGSDIDIFASKIPIEGSNDGWYGWTEATYVFYKYNKVGNTMEKLSEFVLPTDIYNLAYNLTDSTFSYYRTYRASTESIIEYRIINLETLEETELLTIKVDNDSVLYYKPKLVWFDVE